MDAQNGTRCVVFDYGLALMNGFRAGKTGSHKVLGFDMEADCYRTYVVRPGDAIYISKEFINVHSRRNILHIVGNSDRCNSVE